MIGWDRRDAKVDRLFLDFDLNAAVLRQTLFCDAHRASHDLEPADNGRLQALGRRLHFLQHAVNAKPDAEFFIERLQMNVARARAMRLDQ